MAQEIPPENQLNTEFTIEISGFVLWIKRFFQFGAVWILLASIVESFKEGQHFTFIAGALNFCLYWAIAKYAFRTFPRKVSVEGDSIVFHKVPTAWININGIPIPLGITQRSIRSKSSIVLERIGRTLTLNDMAAGKSIRLAAGKHGDALASWFKSNGVSDPVGG